MNATIAPPTQSTNIESSQQPRWFVHSPRPILRQFGPIGLHEMAGVALQNRTDTKFVMRESTLLRALSHLVHDYRILAIDGVRQQRYQTLYFDTADLTLYQRHHAGAANRYKVRARAYMASGLAFVEVKHKTNKNRTIKHRLPTGELRTHIDRPTANFLQECYPYEPAALLPALWNAFTRVTLVSRHRPERLTLDFDLVFWQGQRRAELPGLAIAEVKQEGFGLHADFHQAIRQLGVRPTAFSKYCLGLSWLQPQLKQNRFKTNHQLVQRLTGRTEHDYDH